MTLDELNARLARVCQCSRVEADGAPHPKGYLLAIRGMTADVDLNMSFVGPSEDAACYAAWQIVRSSIDRALRTVETRMHATKCDADRAHTAFVRVLTLHTLAREEKA